MKRALAGTFAAVSLAGVLLVSGFEGEKEKTYIDTVGIPTVCFGHTGPEVKMGQRKTHAECIALLKQDLTEAGKDVARCVKVPITQEQFDAMSSMDFNVGGRKFCASTLVKKLNAGDCRGAANEFLKWSKAGGKELKGLLRRRIAEREMFLKGCD